MPLVSFPFRYSAGQSGFTLIEVLVAAIIFAAGLLGLASMQTIGQRNNHDAYLRSQAVAQAYDIADRMRANPIGVAASAYDALSHQNVPTDPGCITTSNGCTAAEIASYDAREWHNANSALLPMGRGAVTATGENFLISLTWDANRDDVIDADDPSFLLEFRP